MLCSVFCTMLSFDIQKTILFLAAIYTWGLFEYFWLHSIEVSEKNNDMYITSNLWINFNLKLQNHTTGRYKQVFTGERLRYSLSDSITRTECAFPLA